MTPGRQDAGVPEEVVARLADFLAPHPWWADVGFRYRQARETLQRALSGYTLLPRSEVGETATEAYRRAMREAADEAQRYAEFYDLHTDSRNTFVILAERFRTKATDDTAGG